MADCICVRRGDGPEGCGICNETGTTPDIAGLCERLRAITTTDHERLCQGREYTCSCGWDAENEAKATEAADTLKRQAAEIERLRGALQEFSSEYDGFLDGDGHPCPTLARARAALTGEDTAGSPTSQNTEPGLAFSDAGEP